MSRPLEVVRTDPTVWSRLRAAAEEANRRLAFLARAGNVLGRSLDSEMTTELNPTNSGSAAN